MDNFVLDKEYDFEGLLSEENYFQSLLKVLYSKGKLNTKDLEKIQIQIVDILKEKVSYYTRDESSSVRTEVAEQIMLSIYYTIGVYLKDQVNIRECVKLINEKDMRYLFNQGEESIKDKFEACRKLLKDIQETNLITENYAYRDTIDNGMPLFFIEYDIRFASHETKGDIDYPLANDEMKLTGIEYIEDYLKKISMENKFCFYFDPLEIQALLKGFSKDANQLLINIFTLVLTNYLGRALAGKEGIALDIYEEDRIYIKEKIENLPEEALSRLISEAEDKIIKEFSIKDKSFIKYIKKTVKSIKEEIKYHVSTNTLENIFITLCNEEEKKIKFEDGESLENSAFKNVTDEIRECTEVKDKIKIIKDHIGSLIDLVDVLGADCIFGNEFVEIFNSFDNFQLALLLKYIPSNESLDSDYGTEGQKEWNERLKNYFEGIDEEIRNEVINISKQIDI